MDEQETPAFDAVSPPGLPDNPSWTFDPHRSAARTPAADPADPGDQHPTKRTIADLNSRLSSLPKGTGPLGADTYVREELAGKGGFGEVWRGRQPALSRHIAVKRLREDLLDEPETTETALQYYLGAFRQEALTTASLEHPNIVPVYDFGRDDQGRPVIAMKFVRGVPWDKLIWEDTDLDVTEFLPKHLEILIDVAQAVAFAHSRGIVHRDIKPSQVMVGDYGEVLLMDWGLALIHDPQLAQESNATLLEGDGAQTIHEGANPAGTVAFMAPEQTDETCARIGTATDIYLLGGTLYYLLTRTPPHSSLDPEEAFQQARLGEFQDPRERAPDRLVPAELAELAMLALDPVIEKRVPSVREFIEGIRDYITGAGKRLESVHLIEQARAGAEQGDADYTQMAESLSFVERASGLWPANPEAEPLRIRILRGYATSALRHGDLELARIQAESLHESATKRTLLADIEAGERRRRFQQVLIRAAFGLVVVMLLVVSGLAVRLNRSADTALEAEGYASEEATRAARARASAEQLVNFLAEDLYQSLAPLNRLDLLDRLATRAQEYYDSLEESDISRSLEDARNRARLLGNIGEIRFGQGRLEPAQNAFEDSVAMSRKLLDVEPDNIENRKLLAAGLLNLGQTLLITNRVPKGASMLKEALSIWKEVASESDNDGSWVFPVAEIHSLFSGISYVRGDIAAALGEEQESLRTLQTFSRRQEDQDRLLHEQARSHARIADLLLYRGRSHLGLSNIELGVAFIERALNQGGENSRALATLARLHNLHAEADLIVGDYDEALAVNQQALDVWRQFSTRDPSNAEFQREMASSTELRARLFFRVGDLSNADIFFSSAMRMSEDLARGEPSNITYQYQLMRLRTLDGYRLAQSGNPEMAAEEYERALRIINYQLHTDPQLAIWRHARAEILLLSGNAAMQTGDDDAARSSWTDSEALFKEASESDPENYQFILGRVRALCGLVRSARARNQPDDAAARIETARQLLSAIDYHGQKTGIDTLVTQAMVDLIDGDPDAAGPIVEKLRRKGALERELAILVEEAGI